MCAHTHAHIVLVRTLQTCTAILPLLSVSCYKQSSGGVEEQCNSSCIVLWCLVEVKICMSCLFSWPIWESLVGVYETEQQSPFFSLWTLVTSLFLFYPTLSVLKDILWTSPKFNFHNQDIFYCPEVTQTIVHFRYGLLLCQSHSYISFLLFACYKIAFCLTYKLLLKWQRTGQNIYFSPKH